jgi:hypothetical protein
MNKVSKAFAGGITGSVTALGGTAGVAVSIPAGGPSWEQYAVTAVVGFIVGFVGVYFAPANKPS